jgi:hypothetical protein
MVLHVLKQIPLFGLGEQYARLARSNCRWSPCYVDDYYTFVWDLNLSGAMLRLSETNGV